MTTNPPLMEMMKYEVPVVLVLLPLKYQGNTNNLFHESSVPLWCFIVVTFVYWLIVDAMNQITTTINPNRALLSNAALASALFSLISLVAMFLPYPLSLLPLALVLFSLLSLALLYAFRFFAIGIEFIVNKIHYLFVWVRGGGILTEEASSPV